MQRFRVCRGKSHESISPMPATGKCCIRALDPVIESAVANTVNAVCNEKVECSIIEYSTAFLFSADWLHEFRTA